MAQVCWLRGRPREGLKRSRNRRSRRSCKAEGRWRLCPGQPVPDQTRSKQIRPYRVSGKPAIAMPGTPSDALPFPARAIAAKQKLRSFHDVVAKVRALVSDMLQNGNRRDSNSRKWRGVIGWAGAVGANPYLGTDATLRCALAIWAGSLRSGWNWIVSSNKPRITLPPMCPRSRQEAITVYGLQSSSTLFLFGSSQCKYVHIECQQAGLHFTSPAEENSLGVATC